MSDFMQSNGAYVATFGFFIFIGGMLVITSLFGKSDKPQETKDSEKNQSPSNFSEKTKNDIFFEGEPSFSIILKIFSLIVLTSSIFMSIFSKIIFGSCEYGGTFCNYSNKIHTPKSIFFSYFWLYGIFNFLIFFSLAEIIKYLYRIANFQKNN